MTKVRQVGNRVLDTLWRLDPVGADRLGVKGFDGKLPPVGRERRDLVERLSGYGRELNELLKDAALPAADRVDAEVAAAYIEVESGRDEAAWDDKVNPAWYLSAVNGGLDGLVSKDPAPPAERVCAISELLGQVPQFLDSARANLVASEVPPEWLDIALVSAKGHERLVEGSVIPFARSCDGCGEAFLEKCRISVAKVAEFAGYLEDVAREARGSFACGREHFERLLRGQHMVDMDCRELAEFGEQKVAEYEAALAKMAAKIDSQKHWTQLISEFKKDHPTPETLLDSYRNEGELAEAFVREKDLITIPQHQRWSVKPVPEYSRATAPLGYMRTSPPFAEDCLSTLCITPIDLTASPERQEQHLQDNCYPFQRTIVFHEIIPGHHLQSCLAKPGISDLRKQFRSPVFVEGWGLYTETFMAEQGYLDEPATALINIRNALWRAVRVVVDLGLHVGGMSVAEASSLLREKALMEHHMALGEAKRYTMSPTYQSSYMLGKEQIMALRKDYSAKLGAEFTLKGFHDKLTGYGSIPVALVRREMLKEMD